MILAVIFIGFIYFISIGILLIGNLQLPEFSSEEKTPKNRFSIIIPFRNEAQHLLKLLASIQKLEYPLTLFEIIFVDDDSEDASANIIQEALVSYPKPLNYTVISNIRVTGSPKKDAIATAINIAKYEWVLTTDADCQLPQKWLATYNAFIQENDPKLVAGPVDLKVDTTFLQHYQQLDSWSLQSVTRGSFGLADPLLCNGANLAYKKDAYKAVNGFAGNDHIASGDDIFMLEKMKKAFPKDMYYLKSGDAIVTTRPQESWASVVRQRVRWASKTSQQKNLASKVLGVIIFTSNLLVVAGVALCFIQKELLPFYISFLAGKVLIDTIFLFRSAIFFKKNLHPFYTLLSSVLYPFITLCVVFGSFSGSYRWKGRFYKKRIN